MSYTFSFTFHHIEPVYCGAISRFLGREKEGSIPGCHVCTGYTKDLGRLNGAIAKKLITVAISSLVGSHRSLSTTQHKRLELQAHRINVTFILIVT